MIVQTRWEAIKSVYAVRCCNAMGITLGILPSFSSRTTKMKDPHCPPADIAARHKMPRNFNGARRAASSS